MIKLNKIIPLILVLYSCDNVKENNKYYDNGIIKSTVTVKNGIADGPYLFYYENGLVENKGTYVNGLKQGVSLSYYPTGVLQQELYYRDDDGHFQRNFRKDGTLLEESYYKDGQLVDVLFYKKEGVRSWEKNMTGPLFFAKSDTINLGEIYEVEIRLGNRMYFKNGVVLNGDTSMKTLSAPRLPKLDSVTSLYKVKATKSGINVFEGVILDIETDSLGNETTWYSYNFKHQYFVRNSQ